MNEVISVHFSTFIALPAFKRGTCSVRLPDSACSQQIQTTWKLVIRGDALDIGQNGRGRDWMRPIVRLQVQQAPSSSLHQHTSARGNACTPSEAGTCVYIVIEIMTQVNIHQA
eukprot:358404-Chlamydomonas_euryale.AAC.6